MNESLLLITAALDFAARKHAGQRRKDATAEPYLNHLAEVAQLLAEATEGEDAILVAGGLLHDSIEDTGTTHAELVAAFGVEVADLVREVTDDKSLPKAERKRLQILHAPHKSPRAKLLKLADKTSNLRALLASPPVDWPLVRQQDYFAWAADVVAGCRGINAKLEAHFDTALARQAELGV